MQDFTFGALTQVEHRLTSLRQQHSGVQHRHQTLPLDPLPGQAVVVQALTGPNFPVDRVALYYTTDGSEPQGSRGEAQVGAALPMEPAEVEWDLLDWGYLTVCGPPSRPSPREPSWSTRLARGTRGAAWEGRRPRSSPTTRRPRRPARRASPWPTTPSPRPTGYGTPASTSSSWTASPRHRARASRTTARRGASPAARSAAS